MSGEDSKDSRSKAKEALLEWVRKKTSGYVIRNVVFFLLFFFRRFVITWITKFRFYSSSNQLRLDMSIALLPWVFFLKIVSYSFEKKMEIGEMYRRRFFLSLC